MAILTSNFDFGTFGARPPLDDFGVDLFAAIPREPLPDDTLLSILDAKAAKRTNDNKRFSSQLAVALAKGDYQQQKRARRIERCADIRIYGKYWHVDEQKHVYALDRAWLCSHRFCPTCMRNKAAKQIAKFRVAAEQLAQQYPNGGWIFLTLTVPNCSVNDLADTVDGLNKGFRRLTQRSNWPALGWVKTVEVTQPKNKQQANPHLHVLFFVRPSYFKSGKYIDRDRWLDMWRESYGDPSIEIVHVARVRNRRAQSTLREKLSDFADEYDPNSLVDQGIIGALETFKYTFKPMDLENDDGWLATAEKQLTGKRTMATGGVIRDLMKQVSPERIRQSELEHTGQQVMFIWNRERQQYTRDSSGKVN